MRVVNGQPEMRAQLAGQAAITASTGSAGGYFVPVGFYGEKLFQAQKQYDALFDPDVATQISTDTGAPLLISSSDDVENPALILTESSGDSSSDIAVGQITLGGYSFRTPKLIFSREFDEDSFWPIATLLEKSAAARLSIGVSRYLVTGSGSAQPTGIVTACENAGAIIPAASPTALVYSDLENLFAAVNPAYRSNGTWLLNDSTLKVVRGLVDDNHRPLLDITSDGMILFGRPVRLSPSLDDIGVSKYPVVFGDLSYFVVRRCVSGEYALVYQQSENLVEKGLAAARYFARYDSNLICPGSGSPVSVLRMHS
jgi:HK97 family phage major capsid protein